MSELLNKVFKKDIKLFSFWLLSGFIIINFFPKIFMLLYLATLSYKYIKQKENVVYFTIFISLLADVGGLFGNKVADIISIGPIEISVSIIFIFANYLKLIFLSKKETQQNYFYRYIVVYLIYFGFLLFTGLFFGIETAGKSGLRHYFQIANLIILMPIFLVLPKVITGQDFIIRFSSIIFILLFVNVFGQIFFLIFKEFISSMIGAEKTLFGSDYLRKDLRPIVAPWVVLLSLLFGFFRLIRSDNTFKNKYLYIIITVAFFSIFITATRGWILAFLLFILLTTIRFSVKLFKKIFSVFFAALLIFAIFYFNSELIKSQIDRSMERFMTVELIAEGDITAGGTSVRHLRGAEVMQGFYESPVFGLGFSSEALELVDQHVGNQAILMSGGIIGFIIVLYLLLSISLKAIKNERYIKSKISSYNGELKLIPIMIVSLFMIHSTSTALFGYAVYVIAYGNMLWVVILFSLFNKILNEYNYEIR